MSRYDEEYTPQPAMRQKDFVLASNEYIYIQSKTNGQIKTYTGPIMVTISAQESMVVFNPKTKRFEETTDFKQARQLFTSAPENWYIVLKNPSIDSTHPEAAKATVSPELSIGKKINVAGPCSFSLYPGQMTKTVQGHRLRSNQYLLARVYDADAAEKSIATIVDADGKEVKRKEKYFAGQLLVIKGTEVSFYIPPTGIEVLSVDNNSKDYVRDAITLERLEYAILKDEDGEKRYVHGPAVVFPEPTETFVKTPKGGNIFRALELSPISGIYVKVIADYTDEDGTERKTGEELFITGNDQMIYYPRPEHALIQYDGKYMHHAIAIPEGEGRYILNRLSGEIKTVKGPAMYLPDPRTEVVVKRKLTEKECELFYPNNDNVLNYNKSLTEKAMEANARMGMSTAATDAINTKYSTSNQLDTLAIFEANANISRGVSYTKPRTITLDTKFDGVVSIDVWSGYAICVIDKAGNKEVVTGPATRLLDYDETLQTFEGEGGPEVFLKLDDNKIANIVYAKTKDNVAVQIRTESILNFKNDKCFDIENYIDYTKNIIKSKIKAAVAETEVQDIYNNSEAIIKKAVLGEEGVLTIEKNGSEVASLDVKDTQIEKKVLDVLAAHNADLIEARLELATLTEKEIAKAELAKYQMKTAAIEAEQELKESELEYQVKKDAIAKKELIKEKERAAVMADTQARADMQEVLEFINAAELERKKAVREADIEHEKALAEIEETKQKAYAKTVVEMFSAIQPGLIEALQGKTNAELANGIGKAVAPYAIAGDKNITDVITQMVKGTTIESVLKDFPHKE